MPKTNEFGSKEGDEFIATIEPVKISITHIEPALSFNNSLVNSCTFESTVNLTLFPFFPF